MRVNGAIVLGLRTSWFGVTWIARSGGVGLLLTSVKAVPQGGSQVRASRQKFVCQSCPKDELGVRWHCKAGLWVACGLWEVLGLVIGVLFAFETRWNFFSHLIFPIFEILWFFKSWLER